MAPQLGVAAGREIPAKGSAMSRAAYSIMAHKMKLNQMGLQMFMSVCSFHLFAQQMQHKEICRDDKMQQTRRQQHQQCQSERTEPKTDGSAEDHCNERAAERTDSECDQYPVSNVRIMKEQNAAAIYVEFYIKNISYIPLDECKEG